MSSTKTLFGKTSAVLLLLTLGCLLLTACSGKQAGGGGFGKPGGASSGKSSKKVPELFPPLDFETAFVLSESEAKAFVKKLMASGGTQRLKNMDFAIAQSAAYASKKPDSEVAMSRGGKLKVTWAELKRTMQVMRENLPAIERSPELLATKFTWWRLGPDAPFTGYYEPTLNASRTKTNKYNYPIYRLPPDVKSGKSYHDRNAIDRKGVLKNRGLEIAWVDSEVDAFFLQVQGSGRLRFEDGSYTHVLYAGKNNCRYVSLGRIMKERGLIPPDQVNMKTIKEYLAKNPREVAELCDTNPSYVFFREASSGPVGAMGRQLTPLVSLATSRSQFQYGSILFSVLALPDADGDPTKSFYGVTLPQDAGGAIKGFRIDLFCGAGDDAAHNAGHIDWPGATFLLLAK